MAIAPTVLTEGSSTTDLSVYNTASITPSSNVLVLAVVSVGDSTAAVPNITVTGNGLTWVLAVERVAATTTRRTAIFRAMGASPTTGNVSFTLTGGSGTGENCAWRIVEFSGVSTIGSNGAGAVRQSVSNNGSGSNKSAGTLGALRTNSASFGAFNANSTSDVPVVGSGFTEVGDDATTAPANPSTRLFTEWSSTGTNPVVATGGAGATWEGVGIEIVDAGASNTRTFSAAGGNWSATTAWAEGVVPTAADDVTAVPTSGNVTIDQTNVFARSVDMTGYVGTLAHNLNTQLNVGDASGGSFKLVAGMTYSVSATSMALAFVSTSNNGGTGWPITMAGKTAGNVTFNGAGGKWVLQDTLNSNGTSTSTVTLTSGTLDTNNQAMNVGTFNADGSTTRTLTLGSSAISIQSNWTIFSTTNLTVSANTAIVTLTGQFSTFTGAGFNYNGMSISFTGSGGSVTLNNSGGTLQNVTASLGANIFGNLTIQGNTTIAGTLTANGNSLTNRIHIKGSSSLVAQQITAAAVSISNADFTDITAAGAANWNLSANSVGDGTGNTGITFTTPVTRYARSVGGNWSSTTLWATSTGGASGASVPLLHDTVILDANTGAAAIGGDMLRLCKDLTCTGYTGTLTWASNAGSGCAIYGSCTFSAGMSLSATNPTGFRGRGSHTVTMAGKSFGAIVNFDGRGGTYTFQDTFATGGAVTLNISASSIDTNNQAVNVGSFQSFTTLTRSITLGTSTITLATTSSPSLQILSSGLTFSGASSTFVIGSAAPTSRTFAGGGLTYGTLTYTVANSSGTLVITGANTFSTINVTGGSKTLTLPNSTTNTVGALNMSGSAPGSNILTANQSGIETDATGWINVNECTFSRTTSTFRSGAASLQMQKNATVQTYMSVKVAAGSTVTPGETYTATAYFQAATTPRSCQVWLDWNDGGGVHIGGNSVSVTNATTGWTAVTVTGIAPSNAATARPALQINNVALNEIHYADDISVTLTNLMTLQSASAGSQATLANSGGGASVVNYLAVKDVVASPANSLIVYTGGVNNGNTSGVVVNVLTGSWASLSF